MAKTIRKQLKEYIDKYSDEYYINDYYIILPDVKEDNIYRIEFSLVEEQKKVKQKFVDDLGENMPLDRRYSVRIVKNIYTIYKLIKKDFRIQDWGYDSKINEQLLDHDEFLSLKEEFDKLKKDRVKND